MIKLLLPKSLQLAVSLFYHLPIFQLIIVIINRMISSINVLYDLVISDHKLVSFVLEYAIDTAECITKLTPMVSGNIPLFNSAANANFAQYMNV